MAARHDVVSVLRVALMRKEELRSLCRRSLELVAEGFPYQLDWLRKPTPFPGGLANVTPWMTAFAALTAYADLGRMDFLISRLQEEGMDADNFERLSRSYEERFLDLHRSRRGDFEVQVERGMQEALEWFEYAIRGIDPAVGLFPYDTDHEFENEVFGTREVVEFAAIEAAKLGQRYDFAAYLGRFSEHDKTLRELLPFAVSRVVRLGGRMDPPELYPERFWWRKLAWRLYAESTGTESP